MPILDEVDLDLAFTSPTETEVTNLASARAELASLRYLVILTARWESSDNVDPMRHAQLRADLDQHRLLYSHKIDEIAMTYGIQQAMEAKEHVERSVTAPRGARPPGAVGIVNNYDL